jgi:hypothetical protein
MEFLELVGFLVFVFFAVCVAIVIIFVAISIIGAVGLISVELLGDFFREKSSDEIREHEIYKEIFKIQDRKKDNKAEPNDLDRELGFWIELGKVQNLIRKAKGE